MSPRWVLCSFSPKKCFFFVCDLLDVTFSLCNWTFLLFFVLFPRNVHKHSCFSNCEQTSALKEEFSWCESEPLCLFISDSFLILACRFAHFIFSFCRYSFLVFWFLVLVLVCEYYFTFTLLLTSVFCVFTKGCKFVTLCSLLCLNFLCLLFSYLIHQAHLAWIPLTEQCLARPPL